MYICYKQRMHSLLFLAAMGGPRALLYTAHRSGIYGPAHEPGRACRAPLSGGWLNTTGRSGCGPCWALWAPLCRAASCLPLLSASPRSLGASTALTSRTSNTRQLYGAWYWSVSLQPCSLTPHLHCCLACAGVDALVCSCMGICNSQIWPAQDCLVTWQEAHAPFLLD